MFVLTTDNDGSRKLILTIAVLAGTPAFSADDSPTATYDGITYTIQGSTTLENSTKVNVLATPVTTGLPAAGSGHEYRSFSLDGSAGLTGKGFLRAQVTQSLRLPAAKSWLRRPVAGRGCAPPAAARRSGHIVARRFQSKAATCVSSSLASSPH